MAETLKEMIEFFGKKDMQRSESRWLAIPQRWRIVRGHDKPRLMGVAIASDPFRVA